MGEGGIEAIIVRHAGIEDCVVVVDCVGRLLIELGSQPPDLEALAVVFERVLSSGFILLAEQGGACVGVCTVSLLPTLRTGGLYGIVQEMFIAAPFRSTGVGGVLLRRVQAEAKARGCAVLELGTPKSGQRQVAFYARHGFSVIGDRMRCRLDG